MKRLFAAAVLLAVSCGLSCTSTGADVGVPVRRGTLLLIGGGLDDDAELVYRRFLELASARGTPRIVVATAATGPQDEEATDKSEALAVWSPGVSVDILRRETSTAASVAMIDGATAMFFTGGDQKRITDRYRPEGRSTPEWEAMRRLLDRGGVIAGASAGDAMMGTFMILGGGSSRALGIPPTSPTENRSSSAPKSAPAWTFSRSPSPIRIGSNAIGWGASSRRSKRRACDSASASARTPPSRWTSRPES
jgi:cyanophycinase